MNCNNNCSICESSCLLECPICNKKGLKVEYKTARNILIDSTFLKEKEDLYICTSKKCDVVYYQKDNPRLFYKEDVVVPIWYKEKYDKYLVCYCHNIYLDDIVKIVLNNNEKNKLTINDIKKQFIKEKDNCEIKNPTGITCNKLFENAIEFAYKQKKEAKL